MLTPRAAIILSQHESTSQWKRLRESVLGSPLVASPGASSPVASEQLPVAAHCCLPLLSLPIAALRRWSWMEAVQNRVLGTEPSPHCRTTAKAPI